MNESLVTIPTCSTSNTIMKTNPEIEKMAEALYVTLNRTFREAARPFNRKPPKPPSWKRKLKDARTPLFGRTASCDVIAYRKTAEWLLSIGAKP